MNTEAKDCPNCYTDDDATTDCPHLLAGDDCPNCGRELEKPPAGKVECPHCHYVVNGQSNGVVGDFNVTKREAARFLDALGYDATGSFGTLENRLWDVCDDHGVGPEKLADMLKDLTGRYSENDEKEDDLE